MNKQEFLDALEAKLCGLPRQDVQERLSFYGEMIDDRMEEGLSEEEAVSDIGSADEIAAQIITQTPLAKLVKERIKPQRSLKAWEIVLLALGSPVWLSLLIAAFAVLLSLYVTAWSVIASLWAVFASFIGGTLGGIAAGLIFTFGGNALAGIATVGAGISCAGLAIFSFFGCKAATKGTVLLTKKAVSAIKNRIVKKERA